MLVAMVTSMPVPFRRISYLIKSMAHNFGSNNRPLLKPSPFDPWRRQKFVRDPHVLLCTLRSLTNFFLALDQNAWFEKRSNGVSDR